MLQLIKLDVELFVSGALVSKPMKLAVNVKKIREGND